MRTVSIRLEDLAKMAIKIGFVGENEHTRVCIDCKKAFDEYPGAVATLTVQPPAGEAYPDVTTRDGDTVIWDVEDHDLTDEGDGEFQLSFVVDETVMKSYIGRTAICRSILPAGDVPAAIDDWLTRANAALAEIPQDIAAALQAAKESGEFDGRGISNAVLNSDYTLTLTFTDGTSYTTPAIRGEKGDPGKDFLISKVFSSVLEMAAYTGSDIEPGDYALINTGNVNNADNGKLFRYEPGENIYDASTKTASVTANNAYLFQATVTVNSFDPYYEIYHIVSQGIGDTDTVMLPGSIGYVSNEHTPIATNPSDTGLEFTFHGVSVQSPTLIQTWQFICDLSGAKGATGATGDPGFSPIATVSKSDHTATISITDATGTTTAQVTEPTASVSKSGGTATVTITDSTGTTTAQIVDGDKGDTGSTPVISIGTVSTLTPGSDATASMDVTDPEHPVLSLGIPEGEPGDATVDDSKGYGDDENYTWSADKLIRGFDSKAPFIPAEVGESYAAKISDGAEGMPTSGTVRITAFQGGSGTPSASNIRTLYGFSTFTYFLTGKNLHGSTKLRDAIKTYLPNATISETGKYIQYAAGTDTDYGSIGGISRATPNIDAFVPFKENTRYTLILRGYNTSTASQSSNMRFLYTDGTNSGNFSFPSKSATKQTLVAVSAANKTINYIQKANSSGSTRIYYDESGVFEGVLTEADFEAYKGTKHQINYTDTVWGGYFTFNPDGTGTLTVTHGEIESYDGETLPGAWVSDRDVYAEGTTPTTGAQVVYELAEPVTYDLTGIPVPKTVKGENNIYAKTGDIESINYSADTKTYIDQKLSASQKLMELIITSNHENEMKATKAYTTGDLLIVNGTLYKATTSIANGATLTVGTNVTETTVAAEIAALS